MESWERCPGIRGRGNARRSAPQFLLVSLMSNPGPRRRLVRICCGSVAYFELVNARGGIYGRKISILLKDDRYEPDPGRSEHQRIDSRRECVCEEAGSEQCCDKCGLAIARVDSDSARKSEGNKANLHVEIGVHIGLGCKAGGHQIPVGRDARPAGE
jgi:hypothetical protein